MKVSIDKKTCIGCYLCTGMAEEVFEAAGEKANVKKDADLANKKNQKEAKEAKIACPTGAIKITA